jgi:hypothetical protein
MAKHFLVELPDWEDPRIDAGYIRSVLSASDANVVDVIDVEASGGELAEARAELTRLRAGEDTTPVAEGTWPTPAQWIARWNAASAVERLDLATRALDAAHAASECFTADHKGRLAEAEHWQRQAALASEYEASLAQYGLLPTSIDVDLVNSPGLADDTCTVKFTGRFPAALATEGQAWLEGWAARMMARLPPNPQARNGEWNTAPPTAPESVR